MNTTQTPGALPNSHASAGAIVFVISAVIALLVTTLYYFENRRKRPSVVVVGVQEIEHPSVCPPYEDPPPYTHETVAC